MRARFEGSVQLRLGWGWGGDRPLKLFAIGALQLSVLAAEASDCPCSSLLPAAHCAFGY